MEQSICIAGKNNIAIGVCDYILENYPEVTLYAIINRTDKGINGSQRSFKSYLLQHPNIRQIVLEDVYSVENLIFLSAEFDQIVKPKLFHSDRLYNIHFSYLPAYKGMYTSALPIINHEKATGVTFHKIDAGIDTGDIIDQTQIEILHDETAESLYTKLIEEGIKLIVKHIPSIIENNIQSYPQDIIGSSYYSKTAIDYNNLRVNTNQTAYQIEAEIRAFHFRDYQLPHINGVPIIKAEILSNRSEKKAGTIIEENDDAIVMATVDYDIKLYKDHLLDLIKVCACDDIDTLSCEKHLEWYRDEREKEHGWNLLMVAAYNHSLQVIPYLIKNGFNVNAVNYNGTSVLMYAKDGVILHNEYDMTLLELLLVNGANIQQKDFYGYDILNYVKTQSQHIYNWFAEQIKINDI